MKQRGWYALGCRGGETEGFQQQLLEEKKNNHTGSLFIIATSCLSHGINLPSITNVIILYPEHQEEILYQMLGRGGRRGEDYTVHLFGHVHQHFLEHFSLNKAPWSFPFLKYFLE
jgi:superfamily II DNA or RNA helicase